MGAVFRWIKYIYEWCKDRIYQLEYGPQYFVDGTKGSDDYPGTSWSRAKQTIQAALDLCVGEGCVVNVAPGSYTESLNTPLDTVARYGKLIGAGLTEKGESVIITFAAVDVATITVRARGWRISGLEIAGPTGEAAIKLDSENDDCNAAYTQIDHCSISGGLHGIDAIGAPAHVRIYDNLFSMIDPDNALGGRAITSTSGINLNVWEILRNTFWANAQHLNFAAPQAPQTWIIMYNVFHSQFAAGTVIVLTANSTYCIISQNFLGGDYSIAGGYTAGATCEWYGNFADVDGGVTRAAPA